MPFKNNCINCFLFSLLLILSLLTLTGFRTAGQIDEGGFEYQSLATVGEINDISYFPDEAHVIVASNPLPEIIDVKTMKIEKTFIGQDGRITSADVYDNSIITGSEDGSLFIWDINGTKLKEITHDESLFRCRFHPTGDFVSVMLKSKIILYTFPDFNVTWEYTTSLWYSLPRNTFEWNPNGSYLAVIEGVSDNSIILINSTSGKVEKEIRDPSGVYLYGLSWDSSGRYLAVTVVDNFEKFIPIWDIIEEKMVNTLFGYYSDTNSVAWVPNSEFIASVDVSSTDSYLRIWWSNFTEFQSFQYPAKEFSLVACNPNGKEILVFSKDSEELLRWEWNPNHKIERPGIKIEEPLNNAVVSNSLFVQGSAWSTNTITEVRIRIDDKDWFRAEGTTSWKINFDISYLDLGSHTLTAVSLDETTSSIPDIITFIIDEKTSDYTTHMRFSRPIEFNYYSGDIQIRGMYYNEKSFPPQIIQLKINDEEWFEIDPADNWAYTWNSTTTPNGMVIIYARGFDGNKWTDTISRLIYLDNTDPPSPSPCYLYIDYPEEGQEVKGNIEIRGRANFPRGKIVVEIEFNNNDEWLSVDGNQSWSYSINTTFFIDGILKITVRANNGINDTQYVNRIVITKNDQSPSNLPPIVNIISPKHNDVLTRIDDIHGNASDDKSLVEVMVKIDDGNWKIAKGSTTWSLRYTGKVLSKGSHMIYARSYDGELYSSIKSISIFINNSANNGNEPPPPNSTSLEETALPLIVFLIIIIALVITILIMKEKMNRQEERKTRDRLRRERAIINKMSKYARLKYRAYIEKGYNRMTSKKKTIKDLFNKYPDEHEFIQNNLKLILRKHQKETH